MPTRRSRRTSAQSTSIRHSSMPTSTGGGCCTTRSASPSAERAYREAIAACGDDATLHYNLGVLLEDMDRAPEALAAYEAALRADPDFADCHYNLSLLCEKLARPKDAIRHMARYRMLTGSRAK